MSKDIKKSKASGKPWYKSMTMQGLAAAVVVLCVLPRLGIEVPAEYASDIMAAVVSWAVIGLRNAQGSGLALK